MREVPWPITLALLVLIPVVAIGCAVSMAPSAPLEEPADTAGVPSCQTIPEARLAIDQAQADAAARTAQARADIAATRAVAAGFVRPFTSVMGPPSTWVWLETNTAQRLRDTLIGYERAILEAEAIRDARIEEIRTTYGCATPWLSATPGERAGMVFGVIGQVLGSVGRVVRVVTPGGAIDAAHGRA